jgi:hypothetical protein
MRRAIPAAHPKETMKTNRHPNLCCLSYIGKGSSSRRKSKEDQAQPQKTISWNTWIQQQVDKEAKQQKPLKLKIKPPV